MQVDQVNLNRELKNYKVIASMFHRQLNQKDSLSFSRICHSLEISCIQEHYGYYSMGFQPKQKSVDIWPIPFQNGDPIYYQLDNTGKILFALQPTSSLQSFVYPISEANSSTPFNFLIFLKHKRWWVINVINDGKSIL